MKQKLLLVFFVCLLISSCSEITLDDGNDTDRDRSRTERRVGEEIGKQIIFGGETTTCTGDDYIIYTHDLCPPKDVPVSQISSAQQTKTSRPVDILFILDTSASMDFYLSRGFQKSFANFIPTLKHLDWRIFLTNTTYKIKRGFFSQALNGAAMSLEGRYGILNKKYLDRNIENYEDIFMYSITREPKYNNKEGNNGAQKCNYPPYCQSRKEQPLQALRTSFAANKSLVRKNADFVAVIITNTDEYSEGNAVSDSERKQITAEIIYEEFKKHYGKNKKLSVLSLIILPGDQECLRQNLTQQSLFREAEEGKRIAYLVEKSGGGIFSICSKDYSTLARLIITNSIR